MFRGNNEYKIDLRESMRGGNGTVKIEHLWAPGSELRSATRLCARLTLAPGDSIGFHEHGQEEEVFYIVSGTAKIDDNGSEIILHAGDSLLTGGGAGHAVANCGSDDLVMIAFISSFPDKENV